MHPLRDPGIRGLLLAVLLGVGLLVPEMLHGFAHHHAAEHGATHRAPLGEQGSVAAGNDSHDSDHPHLDLIGTPSAKPSFGKAVVVQRPLPVFRECRTQHAQLPAVAAAITPGGREHGPPPPSRAPPLPA